MSQDEKHSIEASRSNDSLGAAFNKRERLHIRRLRQRLDFLRQRVREAQDRDLDLTYDLAERAALKWILERVTGKSA